MAQQPWPLSFSDYVGPFIFEVQDRFNGNGAHVWVTALRLETAKFSPEGSITVDMEDTLVQVCDDTDPRMQAVVGHTISYRISGTYDQCRKQISLQKQDLQILSTENPFLLQAISEDDPMAGQSMWEPDNCVYSFSLDNSILRSLPSTWNTSYVEQAIDIDDAIGFLFSAALCTSSDSSLKGTSSHAASLFANSSFLTGLIMVEERKAEWLRLMASLNLVANAGVMDPLKASCELCWQQAMHMFAPDMTNSPSSGERCNSNISTSENLPPLSTEELLRNDVLTALSLGVPMANLERFYGSTIVRDLAREFVKAKSSDARVSTAQTHVGSQLLARSTSSLSDGTFVEALISSLEADPVDTLLMDPLMLQPICDPVVLSSGFIIDRSCACDELGHLRFRLCPFTRQPLHRNVYPVVALRSRALEWRLGRLREAERIAALLIDEHRAEVTRVLTIARDFLSNLRDCHEYSDHLQCLDNLQHRANTFIAE